MFRAMRMSAATALALAVAVLPVMLDRCSESCEAHRTAVASTPPCHHTTANGTHISQVPDRCGHDHGGTAVMAAKGQAPTGRAFDSIVTDDSQLTVTPPSATHLHVRPHSPPASSSTLDGRSLPLRV